MAKQSVSKQGFQDNRATFVDLSLSRDEEMQMKKSGFVKQAWWEYLNDLCKNGFKMTLKVDARTHSIMAMVQDSEYDPNISPTIWVMRSGSAAGALLKLGWYWAQADGTLPDPHAADKNAMDDSDLFE